VWLLNLSEVSTDDLLQVMPESETAEWEFKSAEIFERTKFGEFKKQKLGKIVSSFANSGGGYLVLGKRDDTPLFDAVPDLEGRTRLEDHLSLVIAQCVTPHYHNFQLFRVPISGSANGSIMVVRFEDSSLAPHQSIADTNYFYRLPGHCVPAPHFYLESLRNRFTKAVVELGSPAFEVDIPLFTLGRHEDCTCFSVKAIFELANVSNQIAEPCAVRIAGTDAIREWTIGKDDTPLHQGLICVIPPPPLFPSVRVPFQVEFRRYFSKSDVIDIDVALAAWNDLEFYVQPLSQNFAGAIQEYRPSLQLGTEGESRVKNAVVKRNEEHAHLRESLSRNAESMKKTFEGIQRGMDSAIRSLEPDRPKRRKRP
jgi:hypothetical protein